MNDLRHFGTVEFEDLDDVLQSIHVVSVDEPVTQVPVGVVQITELVLHDVASDVWAAFCIALNDGNLEREEKERQCIVKRPWRLVKYPKTKLQKYLKVD